MEAEKAFLNPDNTAVLKCPHCGTARTVNVAKLDNRRGPLKVRCTCRSAFRVWFEARKSYRKETCLHGDYAKLPAEGEEWTRMVVRNISITGVGFETFAKHNLNKGDTVQVKFILDDKTQSEVKKKAIVKVVKDKFIGCEFTDHDQHDKALGFYLMP